MEECNRISKDTNPSHFKNYDSQIFSVREIFGVIWHHLISPSPKQKCRTTTREFGDLRPTTNNDPTSQDVHEQTGWNMLTIQP
jgi:hypothetical protein